MVAAAIAALRRGALLCRNEDDGAWRFQIAGVAGDAERLGSVAFADRVAKTRAGGSVFCWKPFLQVET